LARSRQPDRGARGGRAAGGGLGRQEALIYLATGVTLAVAAAVILVGLYITRYRPPRAHVLTVQDERFNAADVVERGAFLVTYQSRSSSADRFAQDTLDVLVNEAILRLQGPSLVGDVTDAEIENEIRIQLGFPAIAPVDGVGAAATATPTAASTADATPAATARAEASATAIATTEGTVAPTATPDDRAAYASAYQAYLQRIRLGRDEFERVIRAQIIEQRLRDQFREAVGLSGPQKRLSRIRVADPALAESIHQQLVDGADFAELHAQHSTGEEAGEGGDVGWAATDALADEIGDAIRDLAAGALSDVVTSGLSSDIFLVTEVSDDQPYDPDTAEALIDRQLTMWLELEQARVTIQRDLSDAEERWVNEQMLARAQAIAAAAAG